MFVDLRNKDHSLKASLHVLDTWRPAACHLQKLACEVERFLHIAAIDAALVASRLAAW